MVTSEPVPEVVGITKNGLSGFGKLCAPEYFKRSSPPSDTKILVAFAVSITEPPPTAKIASQPLSRYIFATSRTVCKLLSGGTLSKIAAIFASASLKADSIGVSKPFARTPLSVMISGFFAPKVASSKGMCSSAALPAITLTGQKNS